MQRFQLIGSHEATIDANGNWSITLPITNFPTASFKIKAVATNIVGNESNPVLLQQFL